MNETLEKKYWKGLEELHEDPGFSEMSHREFSEELPLEDFFSGEAGALSLDRRSFLKMAGFGLSAAALASCTKMPVNKAIPFLNQPIDLVPGVANDYASTCGACSQSCSILVKTREGRPIKIEGNPQSSLNGKGICAVGQASLLSLYDSRRLKEPLEKGQATDWASLDLKVIEGLEKAAKESKKIVLLSSSVVSPSTKKVFEKFKQKFSSVEHLAYDSVSFFSLLEANHKSFGRRVIPHYRFDKAWTIVSLGADFLGTWLAPVEFSRAYAGLRKINDDAKMSYHVQVESGMSLSGSNADLRIPAQTSEFGKILLDLYNQVSQLVFGKAHTEEKYSSLSPKTLKVLAQSLYDHRGSSLVLCGTNDVDQQILSNAINSLLENYGPVIDLDNPSYQYQGQEERLFGLVEEMEQGKVGALLLHDVNPAYSFPRGKEFVSAMTQVPLKVSFSPIVDETSEQVDWIAPTHHFLESWNDAEAVRGHFSLTQPTLRPLFNTRSVQDSLLKWAGVKTDYYSFLRDHWRNTLFLRQSKGLDFESFWVKAVKQGVILDQAMSASRSSFVGTLETSWEKLSEGVLPELELNFYTKIGLQDGKQANNPWLQELPDPITKVAWDNYLCISPKLASQQGLKNEDVVKVVSGEKHMTLPVLVQPGQHEKTISVALGYGRWKAGKIGNVGINAFPFVGSDKRQFQYTLKEVQITKTGKRYPLASTQTHHTLHGRPIVKETSLKKYRKDPKSGNHSHYHSVTLWPERADSNQRNKQGHYWGMVIDLNACTGCSACVIACQAENNVPVVGKDEVKKRREMHWIRIDRYYSENEENPQTVHQPMLCQHCADAPCETVCPVIATNHSSDGLNVQAYNRCVGTRYCANNCPYKVRRFNWFRYFDNDEFPFNMQNDLGKMALNPDIVVRSRGVMEKCSMCIQRIQEGKLNAKLAKRPLQDGDIQTACQQSCPTDAIAFGDTNDSGSKVVKQKSLERNYLVLEEVDTNPVVSYLTKVRNEG